MRILKALLGLRTKTEYYQNDQGETVAERITRFCLGRLEIPVLVRKHEVNRTMHHG